MTPACPPPDPHDPIKYLIAVSVILGVGGDPWMSCGHQRPPRRVPPNHTFYCNNWGWQGSYALPFKEKCTIPTPCIPLANSNDAVDCCIFFDVAMQYLLPRPATFAFQNAYNIGCVGQLNDPCPSSPGATCSKDLFDCCV